MILDEPTNGMDPAGIVEMRDLVHSLANQGKTVVSSHLFSEVPRMLAAWLLSTSRVVRGQTD